MGDTRTVRAALARKRSAPPGDARRPRAPAPRAVPTGTARAPYGSQVGGRSTRPVGGLAGAGSNGYGRPPETDPPTRAVPARTRPQDPPSAAASGHRRTGRATDSQRPLPYPSVRAPKGTA